MNRLTFNRLTFNRLTFNRLTFNSLASGRMGDNELVLNSISELETTPEGRELLVYIARCALADNTTLVAEHEGVVHEFPGLFNLAPDWEWRGLDEREQRMMSACLLTHVNAYGVSVPLSARAYEVIPASPEEMRNFPVYEGTFFGNVFGPEPETYACIGDSPDIASQHSSYRSLRVCTDPTEDCEIVSLGRCQDICETYHPGIGWQDCWANGTRYHETISAYLDDDLATQEPTVCTDPERCAAECTDESNAILDCGDSELCRLSCTDGAACTLNGSSSAVFAAWVTGDSQAALSCHGNDMSVIGCLGSQCDIGCAQSTTVAVFALNAATANVSCRGVDECSVSCSDGSLCNIDCEGADQCYSRMSCTGGAQCAVTCTDAGDCGFALCEGPMNVCADGTVVCNRACP